MNEKKKGFNLLPEYVWMIFVGMLLAILILSNVIPGRADVGSPTPTVTPVPTSALDPTDACLPIYIMGQTYMLFDEDSSTVLSYFQQYDNDLISRDELLDLAFFYRSYQLDNDNSAFFRDVKIALTQLSSQFKGFFVDLIDVGAAKGAYESLYAAVSEVGVPISQGYGEYSTNRVLYMANGVFIDVPIWVWNTAIPIPTPEPEPTVNGFIFKGLFSSSVSGLTGSLSYRYWLIDFVSSNFNAPIDLDTTSTAYNYVFSNFNVHNPFVTPVFLNSPNGSYYNYFFLAVPAHVTEVRVYNLSSSLGSSDFDYIRQNFSYVSISSQNAFYFTELDGLFMMRLNLQTSSSTGTTWPFQLVSSEFSYFHEDVSGLGISFSFSNSNSNNPVIPFLRYGLSNADVTLTPGTNVTPTPTPTNAPLPTSGESIHVILPSGTPTPTPPFFVPGGSDGASGSDSPGSIGSGLSSGQTSGVLQAWNMYVSDNPAMLFLTSTFQALPPELLYPLYILLFILLLLAVIRLFVHFSGG